MKRIFILFIMLLVIVQAKANSKLDSVGTTQDTTSEIFDRAEVMPYFPGGAIELMRFLSNNIHYPKLAQENNLEGKVIIKFTVDTDGSVTNPIVLKDAVGGGCAEEAIRVIQLMPKWKPGIQRGVPVKVFYTLPVSFKLSNDVFIAAKFNSDKISLEDYKFSITNKIKKPKQDLNKTFSIKVRFTVLENGKVTNPLIIETTTQNKNILDKITNGILKMPMWSPEVYNGNARISVQELIFTF